MRVYVLTNEPYHDNGRVLGVYLNVGDAEKASVDKILEYYKGELTRDEINELWMRTEGPPIPDSVIEAFHNRRFKDRQHGQGYESSYLPEGNRNNNWDAQLITEWDIDVKGDPIKEIALLILSGDPIACDLAKDIISRL